MSLEPGGNDKPSSVVHFLEGQSRLEKHLEAVRGQPRSVKGNNNLLETKEVRR